MVRDALTEDIINGLLKAQIRPMIMDEITQAVVNNVEIVVVENLMVAEFKRVQEEAGRMNVVNSFVQKQVKAVALEAMAE